MSLRPQPTRWFELLVIRDDLSAALRVLARSARVQLQSHGDASSPLMLPEYRELLDEFDALERRHGPYWPEAEAHERDDRAEPFKMLEDAIGRFRRWSADAEQTVARLETLRHETDDLRLLEGILRDAGHLLPDLEQLASAGPILDTRLYRLAADDWPDGLPAGVLTQRLASPAGTFLLAIGVADDVEELGRLLRMQRAREIDLPDAMPAAPTDALAAVQQRLEAAAAETERLLEALDALHVRHDLADAIADIRFVHWYADNVPELSSTENFAWITGWTSEADEQALLEMLAAADIKALLHLTEPPLGFEPPLVLANPAWMRPFEMFTNMLGVPAAGEADPTRIVAIVSPLMFGYMFGDVGHGAVLLIAGIVLSRRYPALRLLIAGGAASIVFGFLFGSVFALENLIPPLWLHPTEQPLLVLLVPLAAGAVLLLVGMILDALQAIWQHRAKAWWETGAGLVLCYTALLGAAWDQRLLLVSAFGALWFIVGHAVLERRLAAAASAVAELLESLMQLAVNTISFVRVGAFALAHGGLSLAVVGVAEVSSSLVVTAIVLVLGNALIIALEGLIVSIQTTRLVLFEFFVRFLRAEGRPFVPLKPDSAEIQKTSRRPS